VNPIGASTWIWLSPLSDAGLEKLAPRLAAWGFDALELPVEEVGDWDPARAAEVLAGHRLRASVAAVMAPGRDLAVADTAVVARTQAYLRDCLEMADRIGARVVAGPVYAATGRTWPMTPGERAATVERVVANLRPVVERAGELGQVVALEPLNRFETSLVNTAEQAMEIVDRLDSPACGVLLDTFHMNIEERDPGAAIRACGRRLAHVHACGNDRGAPGADAIDWPAVAAALGNVGYAGALVIESFTGENQAIARAASIWRPLAASQDALATEGLAFLRRLSEGSG
jgi:D-psicose/D-tagatose/L-ribulose 3-epimerase